MTQGTPICEIVPIVQRKAKAWVLATHRHLSPPVGDLYRTSLQVSGVLVAVGMAGRPCRSLQDGRTVEITRIASTAEVLDNACSRLYSALVATGKGMGYRRFVSYTLPHEPGTSLRAAGFVFDGYTDGGEWSRPSRKRASVEQNCIKKRWIRPSRETGLWDNIKPGKKETSH